MVHIVEYVEWNWRIGRNTIFYHILTHHQHNKYELKNKQQKQTKITNPKHPFLQYLQNGRKKKKKKIRLRRVYFYPILLKCWLKAKHYLNIEIGTSVLNSINFALKSYITF